MGYDRMENLALRALKRARHEYYTWRFKQRLNQHPELLGPEKSILITGTGRSGTTWLAEVLRRLPNSVFQTEPLRPPTRGPRELGFGWHQHIPENVEWPEAEQYFYKLLSGLWHHRDSFRFNESKDLTVCEFYIIKFVRAQLLLPWLARKFNNQRTIYILRSPYAVVASQLRHGAWAATEPTFETDLNHRSRYYQAPYTDRWELLKSINSVAGVHAANWAIENEYLINHPRNNKDWITICYEDLVIQPFESLKSFFERAQLPMPQYVSNEFNRPSSSAEQGFDASTDKRLFGWRSNLSAEQYQEINRILDWLGIDFYTREGEPVRERIYNRQPASSP
jgi:hypothetical protein